MNNFLLIFVLTVFAVSCNSAPTRETSNPQPAPQPRVEANDELILPAGTSIRIRETDSGEIKILVVDPRIIYGFASTNMPATVPVSFGQVVEFMNNNASVNIIIEGHTSNMGIAYPYNYDLSVKRARNAKIYLVNRGIDSNRLTESPLGESFPEYPAQKDLRRHEFVVITGEADLRVYNDFVSRLDVRKETTYSGSWFIFEYKKPPFNFVLKIRGGFYFMIIRL